MQYCKTIAPRDAGADCVHRQYLRQSTALYRNEERDELEREYEMNDEGYGDYEYETEMDDLREELLDDQDCWARTDEDGWYYDD